MDGVPPDSHPHTILRVPCQGIGAAARIDPAVEASFREWIGARFATATSFDAQLTDRMVQRMRDIVAEGIRQMEEDGSAPPDFFRWTLVANERGTVDIAIGRNLVRYPMDAEEFRARLGVEPEPGELDRINCPQAGEIGHATCGWDPAAKRPRCLGGPDR
jgi:hypothetical protein